MEKVKTYAVPLGRLLLCTVFIWSGLLALMNPSGTAQYFARVNIPIPDVTVWLAIIIELIGGLAILVGFKVRWVAPVLAIYCLITGFAVHLPLGMNGDAMALDNMVHFYKNLAMAGGFAYVTAFGAGKLSVDMGT